MLAAVMAMAMARTTLWRRAAGGGGALRAAFKVDGVRGWLRRQYMRVAVVVAVAAGVAAGEDGADGGREGGGALATRSVWARVEAAMAAAAAVVVAGVSRVWEGAVEVEVEVVCGRRGRHMNARDRRRRVHQRVTMCSHDATTQRSRMMMHHAVR